MRTIKAAPFALVTLALLAACTAKPPASPRATSAEMATAFALAMEKEQQDPTAAAGYLDLIDVAVDSPESPLALAAAVASLDALVFGATTGNEVPGRSAIAFRSRERIAEVAKRLREAWERSATDAAVPKTSQLAPIRGWIASALDDLALFTGEEAAAATWGERRGCAREATLVGPFDWTPLKGLEGPSPIKADAPLADSYSGIAPFAAKISPEVVDADMCLLDVNATSFLQGTRALVVDFDVPKNERIRVALTTSSAAIVDVGGIEVLRRPFEDGGRNSVKVGAVDVAQGKVRVVVRVAQKGDSNQLELDAWGEDGTPLVGHAPKPGDVAAAKASNPEAIAIGGALEGGGSAEATLVAAGMLGTGDPRAAEHLLETIVTPHAVAEGLANEPTTTAPAAPPAPALALLYARSLDQIDDMPDNKIVERLRASVDQVLKEWPTSWEARLDHARATERRRGAGDGTMDELAELGVGVDPESGRLGLLAASEKAPRDRMLLADLAMVAKRTGMVDVAERAYEELAAQAPGSPLLSAVDRNLHGRLGQEYERVVCSGGTSRADLDCAFAKRDLGDYAGALVELDRLRKLRDAKDGLKEAELGIRMLSGDLEGALKLYDALPLGQRRMNDAIGFAAGRGDDAGAKKRLLRDRVGAHDSPYAIASLARVLGLEPDLAEKMESEGRAIVEQDRAHAFLPGAATAVLKHVERYKIEASGLVHWTAYDLRRVSGTTDVASGASSYGPSIEGRGAPRLLRRRIHKKDGRVLEPDASPNASQGGSDLSQLETGDYVEQILEGWSLPDDTGQIVLDTPDLLPERTSVREAEIELARASSIPMSVWSHQLLGKPEERTEGDMKISVWRLKNAPPRRFEEGVPATERSVGISAGTQTWANVARSIQENVASIDGRDPYITRWAASIAGDDKTKNRALVDKVVVATGKKVKIASGGDLSDVAAMFGGGAQRSNVRSILEQRQGSRSWVVYRTLKELGFDVDLAIAETEPFSSAESFPAHVGRFRHALVVVHLEKDGDVWIDADVEGPPLPPGRISPELRGRQAMLTTGKMVTVEAPSGENGDEADLRLSLDAKGDAKGTFTILLHGRTAQALAEAFETVVGSDRRQILRQVVLGWVPWADIDDVQVSSNEGSWEVALRATISIHGFGRPEGRDGKTWVLPGVEPVHSPVGTITARYATRGKRQSALVIDAPIQYHVHRRIELPANASLVGALPSVDIHGDHVISSRRGKLEGNIIDEDFKLNLPTGTVKAEDDYAKFVGNLHGVDDTFMAGVRVKVK